MISQLDPLGHQGRAYPPPPADSALREAIILSAIRCSLAAKARADRRFISQLDSFGHHGLLHPCRGSRRQLAVHRLRYLAAASVVGRGHLTESASSRSCDRVQTVRIRHCWLDFAHQRDVMNNPLLILFIGLLVLSLGGFVLGMVRGSMYGLHSVQKKPSTSKCLGLLRPITQYTFGNCRSWDDTVVNWIPIAQLIPVRIGIAHQN